MSIIDTKKWLENYQNEINVSKNYKKAITQSIFEPISKYFHDTNVYEIMNYLTQHGIFLANKNADNQFIGRFIEKDFWKCAKDEFIILQKMWNGPDIPIFILPVNEQNRSIQVDLEGRSGVSFIDKIFLFCSPKVSKEQLKSLLAHEYNHVCRLNRMHQNRSNVTLLDMMVMEGIAENAVKERHGEAMMATWTKIYHIDEAKHLWKRWLEKYALTNQFHAVVLDLMYGQKRYPKWMGYNVGYHLVTTSLKNGNKKSGDILGESSQTILKLSDFN